MGRGVYTSEDLEPGRAIEIAPVIVMEEKDRNLIDQTMLHDYIFEWDVEKKQCCMALGYASMYNHSYESNCEYEMDLSYRIIRIQTVKPVKAGQELFINYNGDWDDATRVWFHR